MKWMTLSKSGSFEYSENCYHFSFLGYHLDPAKGSADFAGLHWKPLSAQATSLKILESMVWLSTVAGMLGCSDNTRTQLWEKRKEKRLMCQFILPSEVWYTSVRVYLTFLWQVDSWKVTYMPDSFRTDSFLLLACIIYFRDELPAFQLAGSDSLRYQSYATS